jgi:ribose-phosphate pyrophosphokinase
VSEQDTTVVPFPSSIQEVSPVTAASAPLTGEQPKQVPSQYNAGNLCSGHKGGDPKAGEKKRSSRLSEDKRFKIFSGSANRPLAEEIGKFLGVPVGETRLQRFSDGETHFQLIENVRGADVFLIQPTCRPVDQHLVELLIMMDALKRASAGSNHGGGSVLRLCAAGS